MSLVEIYLGLRNGGELVNILLLIYVLIGIFMTFFYRKKEKRIRRIALFWGLNAIIGDMFLTFSIIISSTIPDKSLLVGCMYFIPVQLVAAYTVHWVLERKYRGE